MCRSLVRFALVTSLLVLTAACGKKDTPPAEVPPAAGSPAATANPQGPPPAAPRPPQPDAAPSAPVPEPIASTDIDVPTPLSSKSISGSGLKKRLSYFYSVTAKPGTVTITGTGRNAPSGAANALAVSMLTPASDRLCLISLGNTTEPKTESATCRNEKAQTLVLRVDLDEESGDFTVAIDGPIELAPAGAAAAAASVTAAGAGSTDIDAPTRLAGPVAKGAGTQQATSYYYALNAGPGEVRLTADGKNASTATASALGLKLQNLRGEVLCEVELGNVTRDDRKVQACTLDAREPVILRVNLDPATIDWRARVDGAVDFEPYTAPRVITIALNEKVLFDSGKAVLKPESRQTLHEAAERIRKFAGAKVAIAGHTDNVGADAANLKLSQARAAAVRDYFVQQESLPADRFAVSGAGKAQPVASNATEEGRSRNRRVDVTITPGK